MTLIAHYRLDGNATDSIGDNDGTVNGGTTWVSGKLGQAAKFDGSSGYITDSRVSDYLHNRPEASIALWVKKDAIQYGFLQLSGYANSNGNLYPYQTNTKVYLDVFRTNRLGPLYTNTSVLEWHHVVITQSPGIWRFYQNGDLIHEAGANDYISTDYLQFELGRNSGSRYCDGKFDDVRIYDHALSEREVRDLSLGQLSHYPLHGDTYDTTGFGSISVNSGGFINSEMGIVADIKNTEANIPLNSVPIALSDNTISCWMKCDVLRADVGGGGFTNRIIQWGQYYGDNSGGIGIQSGSLRVYLRGPNASGWTNTTSFTGAHSIYDAGGWIHYTVVFTNDDRFLIYVNGIEFANIALSVPYTGLQSVGIDFGTNMLAEVSNIRIHNKGLTADQVKELYQQRGSIDSIGNFHSTFLIQNPRARYIRDYVNGSTSNSGNHWLEVRAMYDGQNISLNKPVTSNGTGTRLTKVTDGNTSNSGYAYVSGASPAWVQVDLEEVRNIDEVKVWHYNTDGRTYYGTKTEISEDGVNWTVIFDSAVSGTYQETVAGITHEALALGPMGVTDNGLRTPDISELGVTRGLVAYYPLIGDTKDYADTNDGVNNGATATAEGYSFDGTNDYLTLGSNVTFSTNEWSVSGAFNSNDITLLQNFVGTDGYAANLNWCSIYNSKLAIWIHQSSEPNRGWHYANTVLQSNTDYHFTLTYDGEGQYTYFLNGVSDSNFPTFTKELDDCIVNYIGVYDTSTGRWFNGVIRDIRIHNVALTPEEVALEHKRLMNDQTKVSMTEDCLYINGQFKEITS